MVGLLIKKFVPNRENVTDPKVRRGYGFICSMCGIAINLLLFAGKLTVGILSSAVSVTADAFNNLSDAGSSIVTLIGFRLAAQAPDRDHPYGHGRIEYIAAMIVSGVIILMGVELLKEGAEKIFNPSPASSGAVTIWVLAVSILFKLYMAYYNQKYGKMISSGAMEAVALDSVSDCFATGAVLVCSVINIITGISLDGWAAALVSVLIITAGIKSFKETVGPLLGRAPEREFIKSIEDIVLAHSEAHGIHDLAVHDYGPGRVMVSLHVEVDGREDIFELHDAVDAIEREITQKLGCEAVIHMDPIALDDGRTVTMKGELERLIHENIDKSITVHDFRIVPGARRTTVIFDSAVPAELSARSAEIKRRIEQLVEDNFANCTPVTKIDIQI